MVWHKVRRKRVQLLGTATASVVMQLVHREGPRWLHTVRMLLASSLWGQQVRWGVVVVRRMVIPIAGVAGGRNLRKRGCLRERLDVVVWIASARISTRVASSNTSTSATTVPLATPILGARMRQTVRVPVARLVPVRIVRKSRGRPIPNSSSVHRRLMVVKRIRPMLHRRHANVPPHLAGPLLVALHPPALCFGCYFSNFPSPSALLFCDTRPTNNTTFVRALITHDRSSVMELMITTAFDDPHVEPGGSTISRYTCGTKRAD